jgi:hypothetical protein
VFYAISFTATQAVMYQYNNSATSQAASVATQTYTGWTGDTNGVNLASHSGTGSYTGYLDDARMYNVALTAADVYTLFTSTKV